MKITVTLIIVMLITGCANNVKLEEAHADIKIERQVINGFVVEEQVIPFKWKAKISQCLFLYFTKTKAIDHRTIFSSTEIGEIDQQPDPNSINALSSGIVDGIMDRIVVVD